MKNEVNISNSCIAFMGARKSGIPRILTIYDMDFSQSIGRVSVFCEFSKSYSISINSRQCCNVHTTVVGLHIVITPRIINFLFHMGEIYEYYR